MKYTIIKAHFFVLVLLLMTGLFIIYPFLISSQNNLNAKAAGTTYYVNSACATGCDGTSAAKGWPTLSSATNASNVPANSTVEVVAGSGPYYEKFTPATGQDNVTWNFNYTEVRGDVDVNALVTANTHEWKASSDGSHSGEYYLLQKGGNVLVNGSMEQDRAWDNYSSVSTNERSSTRAHSGTYSRHIIANPGGISQTIGSLKIGTTYRVSGWYYAISGGAKIYFFSNQPNLTTLGSWQHFTYDIAATGTVAALRIYFGSATEFYVDDVMVEELDGGGNPVANVNPWPALFLTGTTAVSSATVDGTWNADTTKRWPTYNKWDWGDYDTLGYSTFYAQWSGGDPTGHSVSVLVPFDQYIATIGVGATGHVINQAKFIGTNNQIVKLSEAATFSQCLFQQSGQTGIEVGSLAGGSLGGTTVTKSKFIDSGHRAIDIVRAANPITVYNNYCEGCHLEVRNSAVDGVVMNFKNNSSNSSVAGSIQWTNTTSTLNENHNQFHIDSASQHGNKGIGYGVGLTRPWTTSDSTDIPSSFNVLTECSAAHPENCGTNPSVDSNGSPQPGSPLIDAGTDLGLTSDYLGNPIYGTPDIGAYEYQPPKPSIPVW